MPLPWGASKNYQQEPDTIPVPPSSTVRVAQNYLAMRFILLHISLSLIVHVVQAGDAVVAGEQRVTNMSTDEAGDSRHEDGVTQGKVSALRNRLRAILRRRPALDSAPLRRPNFRCRAIM